MILPLVDPKSQFQTAKWWMMHRGGTNPVSKSLRIEHKTFQTTQFFNHFVKLLLLLLFYQQGD